MRKLFVVMLVTLFACGDDKDVKKASPGQMLVKVNGEESVSTSISAIVRPATPAANPRASIEGSFETPAGNFKILLSASTQDIFKLMDVGEYIVEGQDIPLNHGIIYYSPDGVIEDSFVSFHVGGDVVGKIVFTQIDSFNKLISGTFECTAAHKDTGEVVTISDGSFTSIPYTE
jgi:hypothetical protein